jgi:hypothetical protein
METYSAAMGFGGALGGDDFVDRTRRELTFVTTSDHAHHNGNVVISDGIDWRDYASNPLLLLGHEGGERDWRALPLGKWVARRATRLPDSTPGVMCRARFCSPEQVSTGSDAWHLADSVYRMALPEHGIINKTSISWTAHEAMQPKAIRHQSGMVGKYFGRSRMVEQSVVLIPANQHAGRVDVVGPEELIKRAASAAVISADEATLIGRYVGVVRPYEIAGTGAEERLQGAAMAGLGGWVSFQPERLVGQADGTLRSIAQPAESETAERPARTVASAPGGAGEESADGGPILSPTRAGDAAPRVRSRLGTQRIFLARSEFPDRESASAWLHQNGFAEVKPAGLHELRAGFTFHPKRDGQLVGPTIEESLDNGVTAYLRARAVGSPEREQAKRPATVPAAAVPAAVPVDSAAPYNLERYLAVAPNPADRAAFMRAAATVRSLAGALLYDRGQALTPEEIRASLRTAALLSRELAADLDRLIAEDGGEAKAAAPKKSGIRARTRAALGRGPDDEEEDDEMPEDEGADAEDTEKRKKKTPEGEAVRDLERAAARLGELLTAARRARPNGAAPVEKPDAQRVVAPAPKAAAYKAAHDRLQDLLASRRAQKAPDAPQGGEATGAGAAVK